MNSHDSEDHGVQSTNPNVLSHNKKKHLKVGVSTSVLFKLCAACMGSSDNDNGAYWPEWLLFCC